MKISYNWLKEYIDIKLDPESLGKLLTNTGLEVEGIEKYEEIKGNLEGLVIGKVLTSEKHPDADKLTLTTVDIGQKEPLQIVCGAPNVEAGQKVVVAPPGTTLHHISGETLTLKKTRIRGVVSEGMICAEDEIGLGQDHSGIVILDTSMPNGTPVYEHLLPFSDHVFEIGLTPNRSDATSHIGVARDIRAMTLKPVNFPSVDDFKTDNQDLPIEVKIENREACPRYSGLTISNLNIKESPRWLQNRLKSIGLIPINNVVDVTNFVQHEMGQPLHAFNADMITGNKVIVKTMEKGSRFTTLDEVERTLTGDDLMICNAKEGMCIAGVFGGIKSGVTRNTKNIFLESAYFSPDYIRKTAQHHELKTDASFRFERGTDPNITVYALKRTAMLIKKLAGGTITSEIVDIYPEKIEDNRVEMKSRNIDRLIGKKIPFSRIKKILESLDIKVDKETEKGFQALVPPYRTDVEREADVIEEILRIYGYDNIEISEKIGSEYLAEFPVKDPERIHEQLVNLLASSGFTEIVTNSLTSPEYSSRTPSVKLGDDVEIINKLSEDLGVLRQDLLFTGLEVVAYNIRHRHKDLKFFELGKIYSRTNTKYVEFNQLALFMTGNYLSENWRIENREVEFHDLYEVIQKIFHKFNIDDYKLDFFQDNIFGEGVHILKNGKKLASLGWLTQEVLSHSEIKQNVLYGSIDWDLLVKITSTDIMIEEVSRFPEVRRDLSLVIDKSVTFQDILKIVKKKENELIRNINVFDYYEGEKIEKNKKAYALSFILQGRTETLTDKKIDKTMNQLMRTFENELGAIIRK